MTDEKKKWYKSKTVWVNIITLIALLAQTQMGFVISPEEQVALLAFVNLAMRAITTTGVE